MIPMNYHFTTTKAHLEINGGTVLEIYTDEALKIKSTNPFKGNIDIQRLKEVIAEYGVEHVPFIRMEASTNLIGGQPYSMQNMKDVKAIADEHGIMIVLDASLIGENAYFIKKREAAYKDVSIKEILNEMCGMSDIVYFSHMFPSWSIQRGLWLLPSLLFQVAGAWSAEQSPWTGIPMATM